MPNYYVETDFGCGIRSAKNIQQMRKIMREEVGTTNVKSVRPAATEDISWVRAMGGYIPEEIKRRE